MSRTRRGVALALAAVVVLMVSTATAGAAPAPPSPPQPPPPAGLGVKLLDGPADRVDDPRAHSYIVDHLAPGTTITREIGISNGDAEPAQIAFYAAAADIQGGTFVVAPDDTTNELTSWTSFSVDQATIQPGETRPVAVTIAVPAGATEGERYGAALAEHSAAGAGGLTMVNRVGIRIYLSVGPGGEPVTAFTIDSMTAQRPAGGPIVTATVHNTGGRAIDLAGSLSLSDGPGSLSGGPFPAHSAATLAPGDAGEVEIALDGSIPNGPWNAEISLTSGRVTQTATSRLTFPNVGGVKTAAIAIAKPADRSPIALAAAGVAVLLALTAVVGLIRRRRRRHRAEQILVLSCASEVAGDFGPALLP